MGRPLWVARRRRGTIPLISNNNEFGEGLDGQIRLPRVAHVQPRPTLDSAAGRGVNLLNANAASGW